MEYDVTGTLKIDTEAFEKALKEAQGKLDKFKKDFQSLNNLSSKDSFKELSESLGEVEKSVQDLKMDFEKVDKSADNVTNSVKDLKKETDNATNNVKKLKNETEKVADAGKKAKESISTLDDGYANASKEVQKLIRKINKLDTKIAETKSKLVEAKKGLYDLGSTNYLTKGLRKNQRFLQVYGDDHELSDKWKREEKYWEEQINKQREYKDEIHKLEKSLSKLEDKRVNLEIDLNQISEGQVQVKKLEKELDEVNTKAKQTNARFGQIHWDSPKGLRKTLTLLEEITSKAKVMNHTMWTSRNYAYNQGGDNELQLFINLQQAWEKLKAKADEYDKELKDITIDTELLEKKLSSLTSKLRSPMEEMRLLRDYVLHNRDLARQSRKNALEYKASGDMDGYIEQMSLFKDYVVNMSKYSQKISKVRGELRELFDEIVKLKYQMGMTQADQGVKLFQVDESAKKLKAETKEINEEAKKTAETVSILDDEYNQATTSAEKLTAETRKTGVEVEALQRRISRIKLDKNFTKDFYGAVRSAEGGTGVELKPVYEKLKKDYKDLVKNKAEFDKLFSNAVRRTNTRLYPTRDPDKHTMVSGRNFGYIDRKSLISLDKFNKLMDKADEKVKLLNNDTEKTPTAIERSVEKLREAHSKWDELRNKMNSLKSKGASESEIEKATAEYEKQRKVVRELTDAHNKLLTSQREEKEQLTDLDKEIKNAVKSSEQLDEPFDQATSSVKKTSAEVDKLKQKFRSVTNNTTTRFGIGMMLQNSSDAEANQIKSLMDKNDARIRQLKEEMATVSDLWDDLSIKVNKAQNMLDKHGEGHRWSKKWAEDLKTIPPEIDKVKAKYESLEDEVLKLEDENKLLSKEYSNVFSEVAKPLNSLRSDVKGLGKMISTPFKQVASDVGVAEKEISEFDKKVAEQMVGLNDMLVESGTFTVEQAEKVNQRIAKSVNSTVENIRQGISKAQGYLKNISAGSSGLFDEASRRGKLKREVASLRGLIEERNRLNAMWRGMQRNSDNVFTARGMSKAELERRYKQQFNRYGAGFLGDANIQKDIQKVNEFHRAMRDVSASTNQWVNQEITDFNRFSKAVQTSTMEAENRLKRLTQVFNTMNTTSFRNDIGIGQLFSGTGQSQLTRNMNRILAEQSKYNKMGNVAGVGFAGSNQFQNLNKSMQEYNRLSNIANLNTERMGLGFEKFGQYSKQAESNVRSLSGVFRTLRTTMSMIGGMFVWEFAFKIMDATKSTISAKSEMESYYKTLHMGSKEIASFNKSLDNTVNKFQKMNKFQLGETISALGVEFKMSTDEMNQIMKVAPMIVNEYLRAGRSTEEAILAIKDISQGEFLRLSRETGVGQKEIKEAGWSGDNKDILSLYQALEKIGKARHWDVFASKATSLNDVMLITENRMTEFATLLSDAVTPIIVGSFNALGDAFNTASRWYEGLGSYDKAIVQMTTLGTAGLTTAGIFNSHLLPAVKNFGTNIISSFLGVDSAIVKEKGLAQAIAHETAIERIANIERKGGQKVLHSKIMTLKAEELANKLGMNTTKLRMRYENLQQMAMKRGTTELKARELAQRSLILAEEQNITTTQAMNILLEEEALAEMGTAKALLVRKLGLDANIVSEEGMVVALNERIAQSFPFISSLVSETLATLGLESATATLVVTLGLMIAPLIAIGVAIAPLIANFIDLQKSYEELADTFDNGQQRINELEQKQKGYQKTIDELSNKTNLTAQEEAKLQEARDGLTYTTEALEDATNRYNKSVEYTHIVNKNIEKVEGMRAKNLKEINKELEKQTGKKETIDSSYGMTTAYKEQYRTLQVIAWEENHRPERFKKLSESIKATSKDQEEYNKKIQEFGNDWNQAYSDMEDAQLKRIDPNADAFTRLWSYFDESWAMAKMDWIEFWADPFASISGELGFSGLTEPFNDAMTQMGNDWDAFWQPINDFFNGFTVDTSFDPFAGLKDWWGSTNDWLDSIMPDISVDSIKDWVKTNIKEPFQKAFREFMKNPLGGGDEKKQGQTGGTATKSINLASIFKFDFGGLKTGFSKGITSVLSSASPILRGAGELWSRISNNNGLKVVSSARQGLSGLKQTLTQKFNEGKSVITSTASSWGRSAYNTGNSIYSNLKSGVGDLGSLIRSKFKGIKEAIDSAKKGISGSVKALADAITSPLSGLKLPSIGFGGGFYGSRRSVGGRVRMPRVNQAVYGSSPSSMGFDTVLATMLTEQGFRSPSSYQFYPNSQKSVQEAWDTGKANCFDGARVILALASMFGLKGHMVTGTWNGTGHSGAVIGGKLYDMTQFQRRGVFRGTAGVHFGSSQQRTYGAGKQEINKIININVTNDLSNARIYGMDDLDSHIKQATEKTFYELNSVDGAIGY